jgi:hypothetical protein
MPRIWITDEAWPTSQAVLDAATAAGAAVVHHGIPASLVDQVPAGTLGAFDLPEPVVPEYPPLDPTGALATLLVVLNVVPLADAANAIHEEPAHLVAEAEAWSLAP